eukprot:CAMPEP_0196763656 /NCGR_PEP_ID=MMETSP1095-20130614/4471_1 /TAXON_ID=96789 ORGANISM="Chromulina nebulosa, Strain UTEXLB2642" /NCGR_SAMPLE_ID=MMETSP1095 /ASSEMBLY_ACC=CAM_ASM_000446 /LENGTH=1012 /DNA_ID=CAMNT_0042117281 /DNA_START=314 /DNA_END=3352 /DNA_ORIENTATION=+
MVNETKADDSVHRISTQLFLITQENNELSTRLDDSLRQVDKLRDESNHLQLVESTQRSLISQLTSEKTALELLVNQQSTESLKEQIYLLERQNSELSDRIAVLTDSDMSVDHLRREVLSRGNLIIRLEAEKMSLLSLLDCLKSNQLEVQGESDINNSVDEFRESINLLTSQLVDKQSQCEKYEIELKAFDESRSQLLVQLSDYQRDLQIVKQQLTAALTNESITVDGLNKDMQLVRSELTVALESNDDLKQQLSTYQSLIDDLKQQLVNESRIREDISGQLVALESTNRQLMVSLSTAESEVLEKQRVIERQEHQILTQLSSINLIEEEKKQLVDQLNDLRLSIRQVVDCDIDSDEHLSSNIRSHTISLSQQLIDKDNLLVSLNKELDELRCRLKETTSELESTANSHSDSQKQLVEAIDRTAYLQTQLTDALVNNKQLSDQCEEYSGKIHELISQLSVSNNEHISLKSLNGSLQSTNDSLSNQLKLMNESIRSNENNYETLHQQLDVVSERARLLVVDNNRLKDEISAHVTSNNKLASTINELTINNQQLTGEVDRLGRQSDESTNQIHALTAQIEEKSSQLIHSQNIVKSLDSQRSSLIAAVADLTEEVDKSKNLSKLLDQRLVEVNKELESLTQRSSDRINYLESQLSIVNGEIEVLKSDKRQLVEKLDLTIKQQHLLEQQIEAAHRDIQSLQLSTLAIEEEKRGLTVELNDITSNYCSQTNNLNEKQEQLTSLTNDLNRLTDQLTNYERVYNEQNEELQRTKKRLQSLTNELDEVRQESSKQISDLSRQLSLAKASVTSAQRESADRQTRVLQLEKELAGLVYLIDRLDKLKQSRPVTSTRSMTPQDKKKQLTKLQLAKQTLQKQLDDLSTSEQRTSSDTGTSTESHSTFAESIDETIRDRMTDYYTPRGQIVGKSLLNDESVNKSINKGKTIEVTPGHFSNPQLLGGLVDVNAKPTRRPSALLVSANAFYDNVNNKRRPSLTESVTTTRSNESKRSISSSKYKSNPV